ncbi:MAG: hypothetical protein AAF490_00505 [Chloroflexota bacterium]
MNQQINKQLKTLNKQLKSAERKQDRLEVASVLSQRAGMHSLMLNWQAAADDLSRVAGLAETDGEHFYQARAMFGQAKALGHLPEQHKTAQNVLRQTAVLFQMLNDQHHQAEALFELAKFEISAENYTAALDTASEAIRLVEQTPAQHEQLLDLYQLKANAHLFLIQFEEAVAALKTAVSIATAQDLTAQAVDLELQIQSFQSLINGADSKDALEHLMASAQASGNVAVIQDVQLRQANLDCENGRYQQATQAAEQIIQAARFSSDPQRFMRYFYASLIIARAEEAQKNRVGVLFALLRAKVYLETHLDKNIGFLINKLLNKLEAEWGANVMRQTVAAYQALVREHGPVMA